MKVEEEEEISNTSNESFVDPISENHGREIREHGREPVREHGPVREYGRESIRKPVREYGREPIREHGRGPGREHGYEQYGRDHLDMKTESQPPWVQPITSPPDRIMASKVLTDLSKHYYDTDLKFSGDLYDSLDTKLKIFYDLCRIAGVSPDLYHDAYPTMLKGRARQFYYDHLAGRQITFKQMIEKTEGFFHTAESQQLHLQQWRMTDLPFIMAKNPDKDLS